MFFCLQLLIYVSVYFQPHPGLESRPDRIFASEKFGVKSAQVLGDGSVYRHRYYYHVIISRTGKLWDAMSSQAPGRSCLIDCGPHASCRCGLCVAGGDDHACDMPDCEECSASARLSILLCISILVMLLLLILYATLRLLRALNYSGYGEIGSWLGAHCCLCNPALYFGSQQPSRHRPGRLARLCCCSRLPPMPLLLSTLVIFFCAAQLTLMACSEVLNDIYSIIPEELYPSDHLLFTATLSYL